MNYVVPSVVSRSLTGLKVKYRGLSNYLYDFGGSLLELQYNVPQNPILIIEAPFLGSRVLGFT